MKSFTSVNCNAIQTAGKIAYAALFIVLVPALIVLWAWRMDAVIKGLPLIGTPALGLALVGAGFLLVASAWWALMKYGEGLPMNAFPPRRFVERSIYAIMPHPIYTGFVIMSAGYFITVRSGAGLWLVTPCVALASAALVLGYERHDLEKRFGTVDRSLLIRLPAADDSVPSSSDRLSALVLAFLPWLCIYEAAIVFGPASDAMESYFSFEGRFGVIEWTEVVYGATYCFVIAVPLLCRRKSDLRRFIVLGQWATAAGLLIFLLIPFKATPRPFQPITALGELLQFERSLDGAAASFPSFHVIWSLLAAWLYSRSFGNKPIWYVSALAFAGSCITTGMHSIADLIAGFLVYILVLNGQRIWHTMLRLSERVANSWREWRIGKVRIIVHGIYPAAGVFLGVLMIAHLTGSRHFPFVLFISFASLIAAGLWGQAVEGSSKLSRPFGYYGGLLGGSCAILISAVLGADGWLLLGAFCIAAPFIQAFGRLRCLVQGCCHGRECEQDRGIRFIHPRSRVLAIANLGGRPVYPTQLYSILSNLVLGALLIRVWTLSAPMPFIAGAYFLLGGISRFVEESYRGEPQTPVFAGLALYQWLAIVVVLTGAVLMTVPGEKYTTPVEILPWVFFPASVFAIMTAFAMGVDFPKSASRFSRLAQD